MVQRQLHRLRSVLLFSLALLMAWHVPPQPATVNAGGIPRPLPTERNIAAACPTQPADLQAIGAAVQSALAATRPAEAKRVWQVHSICRQEDWAYAYVKSYDPASGAPLPSHSDLVLAELSGGVWKVFMPERATEYNRALRTVTGSLIPEPAAALQWQPEAGFTAGLLAVSHYALPYPSGESAYVIKHWYPAIDFSIGTEGQTGTVRNAKAGVAVFVKGSSSRACGDPPPDFYCWMSGNAVVIQSAPNEFAWYLHLAPNSIPAWIQEGVHVPAGADLGVEGVTGWAASEHLHFMVASVYSCCDGSGDSRMPHWPFGATHRVDFTEYSWANLGWIATSQNGSPASAPAPGQPAPSEAAVDPPPTAPPAPAPEATPVPTAPPASATCPNPYIVKPGEWLLRIATACQVAYSDVLAANPGLRPNLIYAGQSLNMPGVSVAVATAALAASATPQAPPAAAVPAPPVTSACTGTHVVAPGENLFRIAYNCGLTTQQMAAANGIGYPYTIYAGQVLRFP